MIKYNQLSNINNKKNNNNNSNNNNNNTCNRKNNNTIKNLLICFLDPLANIWLQERKRFDTCADKSPDGHCNGYNVLFLFY